VHSRAVRKPLVAIILSILKCMFYSRSISSAGVRIGYVQFFVRIDHDALVLSLWATRPPTGHGLLGGHAPCPSLYRSAIAPR